MRSDILAHVKDIAEKYLIPGETQDIAMMFVPAESVYADPPSISTTWCSNPIEPGS